MQKNNSIKKRVAIALNIFAMFMLAVSLISGAQAYTRYSPAAQLQPNDITSTMIKDGTITNVDVSSAANIALTKLATSTDYSLMSTSTQSFSGSKVWSGAQTFSNTVAFSATTSFAVRPSGIAAFGGTGADGALTATSSDVTIDLAGATTTIKNYTAISITGTSSVSFTNPAAGGSVVIFKSQGNCTITSTSSAAISVAGLGAIGGATIVNTTQTGNAGSQGTMGLYSLTNGGGGSDNNPPAAGAAASVGTMSWRAGILRLFKYPSLFVGGGGASSGTYNNGGVTSQPGGRGGGAFVLECGGALNFGTGATISAAGQSPAQAIAGGSSRVGGSGAGAGGFLAAFWNSLTANLGTWNVSGGIGGASQANHGGNNICGAGSGSNMTSAGQAGTCSTTNAAGVGGNGPAGTVIVEQNTEY